MGWRLVAVGDLGAAFVKGKTLKQFGDKQLAKELKARVEAVR